VHGHGIERDTLYVHELGAVRRVVAGGTTVEIEVCRSVENPAAARDSGRQGVGDGDVFETTISDNVNVLPSLVISPLVCFFDVRGIPVLQSDTPMLGNCLLW
jgi:hypothetical protein